MYSYNIFYTSAQLSKNFFRNDNSKSDENNVFLIFQYFENIRQFFLFFYIVLLKIFINIAIWLYDFNFKGKF